MTTNRKPPVIVFDGNFRQDSRRFGYREVLSHKIQEVTGRLGEDFSQVKWILYDPEKPIQSPENADFRVLPEQRRQNLMKPFSPPRDGVFFGFCYYESKVVFLSAKAIERQIYDGALGFERGRAEEGACLSFLAQVLVDELAHIAARENSHASPRYQAVHRAYLEACGGL